MKLELKDITLQELDDIQYWLGAQEFGDTKKIIDDYGLDFREEEIKRLDKALGKLYAIIKERVIYEVYDTEGRIIK